MAKFQRKDVFYPKFFSVLKKGYTKKQFTKDLFSGIIVGIVALPLAIAFAVASGVSPDKGIVTAIIAGFLISFLGGSRVQIGGPTGAFVIIISGIVAQYPQNIILFYRKSSKKAMSGGLLNRRSLLDYGRIY